MGEVLQFQQRPVRVSEGPHILEVRSGVYLAQAVPPPEVLESGEFVTASHFATAGERIGKTEQFGRNTMRVMAFSMAREQDVDAFAATLPNPAESELLSEYHMITFINRITQNPVRIRDGSWGQLLFDPQLVRDTWARANGSELVRPRPLPKMSKVGHQVVSQVVTHLS